MSKNKTLLPVESQLLRLLEEIVQHDGYGSINVNVRLLKRGQKEVIVECGKHYRFVVDVTTHKEA